MRTQILIVLLTNLGDTALATHCTSGWQRRLWENVEKLAVSVEVKYTTSFW